MPTLREVRIFFEMLENDGIKFVSNQVPVHGVDLRNAEPCDMTWFVKPQNTVHELIGSDGMNATGLLIKRKSAKDLFKYIHQYGNDVANYGPKKIPNHVFAQLCSGCFGYVAKNNRQLMDSDEITCAFVHYNPIDRNPNTISYSEYNEHNPYKILLLDSETKEHYYHFDQWVAPIDEQGSYYVGLAADGPRIHTIEEWKHIINRLPSPVERKA
jgi:hypothetical protein